MNKIFGLGAMLAVLAIAPAVNATTLDVSACCGSGPFGTVTLTQNGSGDVLVTETLFSGIGFVKTGAGDAIAFSITGDPSITIANLTSSLGTGTSSGFAQDGTPKSSPYGPFMYGISCTAACGSGGSSPYFGTISFDVQAAGLLVSSFTTTGGHMFASDVINNNILVDQDGKMVNPTGNVTDGGGTVPEPTTISMLGAGLLGLGFIRRRIAK